MEPEEVNLLEIFKYVAAEMHDLRESIDKLTTQLETFKNEPIMRSAAFLYDYVEEVRELRKLFKWYAERTTHRKYPEE